MITNGLWNCDSNKGSTVFMILKGHMYIDVIFSLYLRIRVTRPNIQLLKQQRFLRETHSTPNLGNSGPALPTRHSFEIRSNVSDVSSSRRQTEDSSYVRVQPAAGDWVIDLGIQSHVSLNIKSLCYVGLLLNIKDLFGVWKYIEAKSPKWRVCAFPCWAVMLFSNF
jgi:hypothetical protein